MNFPVVSGGFALLATTGGLAAGLGGPAAAGGATVGALTLGGVVTGLVPMVAAGALGILGEKISIWKPNDLIFIRSIVHDVCWPGFLHHTCWSVLPPCCGPGPR